MNRREFLHITALGSAAGVMSFTGLGLLWEDAPPDENEPLTDAGGPSPTDVPVRSTDATSTPASTADGYDTDTSTDRPTETATSTATTVDPTDTDRPASSAEGTTTPAPLQNIDADFTPLDDNQEVYVQLKNDNAFAVDVTVTITWGYDDGTNAMETVSVPMEADSFWADSVYRDAGERTVRRWGHELDAEKR